MIKKIKILKKYASLDTNFVWDDIPKFAVISGINGAGKTKFLEVLYQASQNTSSIEDIVLLEPNDDLHGKIQYVPIDYNFGSLYNLQNSLKNNSHLLTNYHSGTIQQVESRYTEIVKYLKSSDRDNLELENIRKLISQVCRSKLVIMSASQQ